MHLTGWSVTLTAFGIIIFYVRSGAQLNTGQERHFVVATSFSIRPFFNHKKFRKNVVRYEAQLRL